MKGLGTIVFILAFLVMFFVTFALPEIPIGRMLYGLFAAPDTNYLVLEISVTTLIIAVFNGVFYGIIAWLIFTVVMRLSRPPKPGPVVPH